MHARKKDMGRTCYCSFCYFVYQPLALVVVVEMMAVMVVKAPFSVFQRFSTVGNLYIHVLTPWRPLAWYFFPDMPNLARLR